MSPTAATTLELQLDQPPGRRQAIEQLFARISDTSSLATGAQEIVRLANRSSNNLEGLQQLIQADPSLVALILRRVNSAYYRLDREVHDLTVAAQLLGFREFRNLAVTVHLARMFGTGVEVGAFSTSRLWSHSVAVAAVAHLVARVCGHGIPGDAYMAGLLHDVGLLLVHRQMRRCFLQLINQVKNLEPTPHIERRIYSFDHAQLGAYVAHRWDFPTPIVDAVQYHHETGRYTGPDRELLYVVATANYLCSRAGWTSLGVHNVPLPTNDIYRVLGLDEVALAIIWEQMGPTLDNAVFLAQV